MKSIDDGLWLPLPNRVNTEREMYWTTIPEYKELDIPTFTTDQHRINLWLSQYTCLIYKKEHKLRLPMNLVEMGTAEIVRSSDFIWDDEYQRWIYVDPRKRFMLLILPYKVY